MLNSENTVLVQVTCKQDGSGQWRTAKVICCDDGEGQPVVMHLNGNKAGSPAWKMMADQRVVIAAASKAANYKPTGWRLDDEGQLPQEALEALVASMADGWQVATPAEVAARLRRLEGRDESRQLLAGLRREAAKKEFGFTENEVRVAQVAAPAQSPRYDRWTATSMKEELASWGVDTSGSKDELLAKLERGPPPKPIQDSKESGVEESRVAALETALAAQQEMLAAILAKLG